MDIVKGKMLSAQKIALYGTEGIGKSTFASCFPDPLFIDTEGSTKLLDVSRFPRPSSWTMLQAQVQQVRGTPGCCKTLVIDTADWAEHLCIEHICTKAKVDGLESFGYGKGYTYLEEEFGRFLNLLEEVITRNIHVVLTAHAKISRFEQPDEVGSYDRWEMKLQKKTTPLVKEWADAVLFANYKTYVINVDNQGTQKGKNKAQGGARVLYTIHHSCWDAKNRYGLPDEVPFDYASIAAHIAADLQGTKAIAQQVQSVTVPAPQPQQQVLAPAVEAPANAPPAPLPDGIPAALRDLMLANTVTVEEVQYVVTARGYYSKDTPISNYAPDFIQGVLIGAWPQVYQMIQAFRTEEIPF